jgi:GntR family transcriptional regulator
LYKHLDLSRNHPLFLTGNFSMSMVDAIPLHSQIERELRRMVALPEFQNGTLLPTEISLANRFGVSRGTVRAALTRLVERGLLQRKPGVGTRVSRPAPESSIGAWRSFSQEMARNNIKVESFFLKVGRVPAPIRVALALQIDPTTEILRLDRVRGWDGQPVLHSRSWFHPRIRLAESADFSRPLYELVQAQTGAMASSAREQFSAVKAKGFLVERLRVRHGLPLLLRSHTVFDTGKRPMEFAEVHYVSLRFTLTLELKEA